MGGARWALVLQASCLSPLDAVDCPHDLDEDRAQESELARIRSRSIKQSAHRAHDVLMETRLEKLDLMERAFGVREQLLVLFGGCGGRVLPRRRQHAGHVGGGEVQ